MLKVLTFVLLSLGGLGLLSFFAGVFPWYMSAMTTIGEHVITYGNVLFVLVLSTVIYITSKV